jgi:hypothetical protein
MHAAKKKNGTAPDLPASRGKIKEMTAFETQDEELPRL